MASWVQQLNPAIAHDKYRMDSTPWMGAESVEMAQKLINLLTTLNRVQQLMEKDCPWMTLHEVDQGHC